MSLELCRSIFRTLGNVIPEAYSKPCQLSKTMVHIENPDIVRAVYLSIFSNI